MKMKVDFPAKPNFTAGKITWDRAYILPVTSRFHPMLTRNLKNILLHLIMLSVLLPSANWTALGPTGTITNGDWGGAGRVNFLRFDPVNTDKMWLASPLGGLWHSINGGQTWTSNTDILPIVGCSDIAIDPQNTQIMYLATGMRMAQVHNSR
jgi:hypothetical protein